MGGISSTLSRWIWDIPSSISARWTPNLKSRPITNETRELLDRLEIDGKRNFYAIRHTFETIGGIGKVGDGSFEIANQRSLIGARQKTRGQSVRETALP